ncbi:MAG: diaminopimelate decarboxylase [Bacteroidota bacterium]
MHNATFFTSERLEQFEKIDTPFYAYDLNLLSSTLQQLKKAAGNKYHVHYALKANAHPLLLGKILDAGFGADCVSGNEVQRALDCGFKSKKIVFAGVGKSDKEINLALDADIFCFNVESIAELKVIHELASQKNKIAKIALRINPNVDAYTHKYITTGLEENKFGINPYEFDEVLATLKSFSHVELIGLHFHIGSQIKDLNVFKNLCLKVNDINRWFLNKGSQIQHLNLGGGLGINYAEPDKQAIVNFDDFFKVFDSFLEVNTNQQIHFELGRSIIAQCGHLISRVLYIKNGINTNFMILDAGMTELIRPALYQAFHKIENISQYHQASNAKYDVVGPICESSDCFGKAVLLPQSKRGDLIVIRSAGAYGEVMSNRYNLRDQVQSHFF